LTLTPTPKVNDPKLDLFVQCNVDLTATFTIVNNGGPMTVSGSYTVTVPGQSPQTNGLTLAAGQSISFTAAGNAKVDVTYSTSQLISVNLSATGTCLPLPSDTPVPTDTPTFTPTNTRTPGPSSTPTLTRTPASRASASLRRGH
jgi:hypothetical protein